MTTVQILGPKDPSLSEYAKVHEVFVSIGQYVSSGQVLAKLVFANKLVQIKSDHMGSVEKIFLRVGQHISQGQILFEIKIDSSTVGTVKIIKKPVSEIKITTIKATVAAKSSSSWDLISGGLKGKQAAAKLGTAIPAQAGKLGKGLAVQKPLSAALGRNVASKQSAKSVSIGKAASRQGVSVLIGQLPKKQAANLVGFLKKSVAVIAAKGGVTVVRGGSPRIKVGAKNEIKKLYDKISPAVRNKMPFSKLLKKIVNVAASVTPGNKPKTIAGKIPTKKAAPTVTGTGGGFKMPPPTAKPKPTKPVVGGGGKKPILPHVKKTKGAHDKDKIPNVSLQEEENYRIMKIDTKEDINQIPGEIKQKLDQEPTEKEQNIVKKIEKHYLLNEKVKNMDSDELMERCKKAVEKLEGVDRKSGKYQELVVKQEVLMNEFEKRLKSRDKNKNN